MTPYVKMVLISQLRWVPFHEAFLYTRCKWTPFMRPSQSSQSATLYYSSSNHVFSIQFHSKFLEDLSWVNNIY